MIKWVLIAISYTFAFSFFAITINEPIWDRIFGILAVINYTSCFIMAMRVEEKQKEENDKLKERIEKLENERHK